MNLITFSDAVYVQHLSGCKIIATTYTKVKSVPFRLVTGLLAMTGYK